jgi:hypothetical protein
MSRRQPEPSATIYGNAGGRALAEISEKVFSLGGGSDTGIKNLFAGPKILLH